MDKKLIAVEHLRPSFTDTTKIEWFIGLACNFSCTYCAEYRRSGFGKKEEIISAIDRLSDNLRGRKIDLLLGGGEPSIHPDIKEICKHIHGKKINLSMITNGAKRPQLYVDMLKHIQHYTFSLHPEMHYQKSLESINAIYNASENPTHSILVNLMMVPGYFNILKELMVEFDKKNIRYILRRIRPLFDSDDKPILPEIISTRKVHKRNYEDMGLSKLDWGYYTQEEVEFLNSQKKKMSKNTREFWRAPDGAVEVRESNANEILLRKDNRFEGWSCYVGIERLHIYPNGDVYRSTCKVGGKLGNVYTSFSFPTAPITCTKKRCTCAWAVNLSKAKKSDDFSLLRTGNHARR